MAASELRVRLKFPVRGAKIVSPLLPLPSLPASYLASSSPGSSSEKPSTLAIAPTVPTVDPAQAEIKNQLRSDRQLIENMLTRLVDSVHELQTDHRRRLAELQQAAVEIALTIATRLLHQQISKGDFNIEAMVREMVGQLGDDVPVTIRLNPQDLQLLERRLDGQPLLPDSEYSPKLIADASLGRSDARVEAKEAMLLSELPGQLTEVREELLRSLGHDFGS